MGDQDFYAKRRETNRENRTRTNNSESKKRTEPSVYFSGPSPHTGTSMEESLSDSKELGSGSRWSDGDGGQGELWRLGGADAPVSTSSGISSAGNSACLYTE